jgi:alkaline phosphatase D
MGYIPESQNIILDEYIDLDDIAGYAGSNPVYLLQPEEGKMDEVHSELSAIPHLKVWTKDNVPEHYHYGTNNRIFDLVVEAEAGWGVNLKERSRGYSLGTHGYDPANKDMHAIFYAMGPAFKSGYKHNSFDNVCLYPLLAEILKLEPVQTDGQLDQVRSMLKD